MATAPTTQEEPGAERRMSLRRARGGASFSSGISTSSESYREPAEDEPDLTSRVAGALPRLAPPSAAPDDADENRRRLAEATMAGDSAYAREFRLGLLHRLLMRGISLDNIAREMGVSISTVKTDRTELKRRLRENAKGLDINELIGGQLAFYEETTAMSLRMSSQAGTPTAMRLAAIRTALASKADQTRFLTSAGVFDVLSFRRAEDGQDISDVQMLMQQTEAMLARLDEPEEDAAPAPRVPKVLRRNRPGGFSFDDASASSSNNEVVDI